MDPEAVAARVAAAQVGVAARVAAGACGRPANRVPRPAAGVVAEQARGDLAVVVVQGAKVAAREDPEEVQEAGLAAELVAVEADLGVVAELVVEAELEVGRVRQANPVSG